MRVHFEDCCFDSQVRELRRAGRVVALSPKAFQLLSRLLESRPRPLPQRDLKDALWPDTSVGYTSLARVVGEVRKAIGDTARPGRLVRTVPRFGYAFTGSTVVETEPPSVGKGRAFVAGAHEFDLPEGETLVGRGEECGVRLPSSGVSRVHARVRAAGDAVTVEDARSKNGTWVNGERRQSATALADGDEVIFGTFRVVFRCGGIPGSTRTGKPG
jgi:DNA-binding winged helix-turn-helix (wHTH) protein